VIGSEKTSPAHGRIASGHGNPHSDFPIQVAPPFSATSTP
jgi:hypothetical protein